MPDMYDEQHQWVPKNDSKAHAMYSAVVTLTLGVLGSTILPLPYAISKIGVLVGVLTMLLVAFVNDNTCCMLIRAAAATGRNSYEDLAEWAGGKKAKVFTQVCLVLLLYGTMCGGLAFLSDVARIMISKGMPNAPDLLKEDGRPVMLLVVATVLYPLCLKRHIREFEKAATAGVVVVVALMAIIVALAVQKGFPAIADGQLPVFSLNVNEHLPEAFAVIGFAFYMQPMLMPLLREMPPGREGVMVSGRAVHIVLYGVACMAYGTVGVFGASLFGEDTESNIMVNDILDGRWATFWLYASLMLYLCCGMVTTHFALRASVDTLYMGVSGAPWTTSRQVVQTTGIICAALVVAVSFPTYAEKIFAVTGCTAVCLVCYVIPVYIHLELMKRTRMGLLEEEPLKAMEVGVDSEDSSLAVPLLVPEKGQRLAETAPPRDVRQWVADFSMPILVVSVGVGCSLAGLWVAALDIMKEM